jgi:hypothetical protein
MKSASVVSEAVGPDLWAVENKDPNMRYVIARKDDAVEQTLLAQRGYHVATGQEQFMVRHVGLDGVSKGNTKVRGDRVIMCCPKERYEARERERLTRYTDPKSTGEKEARGMSQRGLRVQSQSEIERNI